MLLLLAAVDSMMHLWLQRPLADPPTRAARTPLPAARPPTATPTLCWQGVRPEVVGGSSTTVGWHDMAGVLGRSFRLSAHLN